MEPKGAPTGPPGGRPSAGEPVRIWFRVGLPCSPEPNGLVGDGAPRPAGERTEDKGFATAESGEAQRGPRRLARAFYLSGRGSGSLQPGVP